LTPPGGKLRALAWHPAKKVNKAEGAIRENLTLKDVNFCSPRFFSFFGEKITQILWDNPHGHQ
jgi:hypothetical protein